MADNKQIARDVLNAVGGQENVTNVTHCMTRLRFNLRDESIPNDEAVKGITGVLGVARSGGQYQVIIGQNVPKVYDEVCKLGSFTAQAAVKENLDGPKEKLTPKKIGNDILNYMAGSLTPLIPILMVSGIFKTVMAVLGPEMLGVITPESSLYILLDFVYDAAFYFLPILLGFQAAKKLGATPILGAYMGCILMAPDLIALVESGGSLTVFGIPCMLNNYAQSVLPVILSVWALSYVEKFFKKVMPDTLATIFTPVCTMAVMLPISLCLLAPLGSILGSYIGNALIWFGDFGGFVAIALVAALWQFLVMSGMHLVILIMLITNYMETGVMEGIGISGAFATVSVFGVALGAFLRLKNKEDKSMALGCFISGFVGGVTEPTLYGLCFKFKRTFLAMMGGAALGAAYSGLLGCKGYVMASSNFMTPMTFAGGTTGNLINGVIGCVITVAASAVLTYLFGFSKDELAADKASA